MRDVPREVGLVVFGVERGMHLKSLWDAQGGNGVPYADHVHRQRFGVAVTGGAQRAQRCPEFATHFFIRAFVESVGVPHLIQVRPQEQPYLVEEARERARRERAAAETEQENAVETFVGQSEPC
jgi:hypothetical protein